MDLGKLTDPTYFFWGILPALIAVASLGISIYCLLKSGTWIHFLLTPVTLGSALYGAVMLYNIFIRGAWPTYLAHLCILMAAGCAGLQMSFLRARERHLPRGSR